MTVEATNPYLVIVDGVAVNKAPMQALFAEINTRLGEIPLSPAPIDTGMALVYADNGKGPSPASDGVLPVKFAGRQVGFCSPVPVEIDASRSLTDTLHRGNLLLKKTTSAAVLSLEVHLDPDVGVSNNFICMLLRYRGSGDLQIVSGMANQHSAGHTRVTEGGMAMLYVDYIANVWFIKGETEL